MKLNKFFTSFFMVFFLCYNFLICQDSSIDKSFIIESIPQNKEDVIEKNDRIILKEKYWGPSQNNIIFKYSCNKKIRKASKKEVKQNSISHPFFLGTDKLVYEKITEQTNHGLFKVMQIEDLHISTLSKNLVAIQGVIQITEEEEKLLKESYSVVSNDDDKYLLFTNNGTQYLYFLETTLNYRINIPLNDLILIDKSDDYLLQLERNKNRLIVDKKRCIGKRYFLFDHTGEVNLMDFEDSKTGLFPDYSYLDFKIIDLKIDGDILVVKCEVEKESTYKSGRTELIQKVKFIHLNSSSNFELLDYDFYSENREFLQKKFAKIALENEDVQQRLKRIYRGSRTIKTGPRGGRYYINSNGNKTYVPRN